MYKFNLDETLVAQQQALALTQRQRQPSLAAQGILVVIVSLLGGGFLAGGLSLLFNTQEQFGLIVTLTALACVSSVLFAVQFYSALKLPDLVTEFTQAKQTGRFKDCDSDRAVLTCFQKEILSFKNGEVFAISLCALTALVSPLWYLASANPILYLGLPLFFSVAALALSVALLFKKQIIKSRIELNKAYLPSLREVLVKVITLGIGAAFLFTASFVVLEVCKQRELTDLVGRLNTAVYLLSSTHKGNVETGSWMTKEAPLANDVFLRKWEDKIKAAHPEFGSDVKIDTFFKVSIADLPFQGTNYAVYAVVLRVPKHIAEQHPAPFKDSGPVVFERIPSELEAKLARVAEENVLRSFRTP